MRGVAKKSVMNPLARRDQTMAAQFTEHGNRKSLLFLLGPLDDPLHNEAVFVFQKLGEQIGWVELLTRQPAKPGLDAVNHLIDKPTTIPVPDQLGSASLQSQGSELVGLAMAIQAGNRLEGSGYPPPLAR